jgi:hypothetical protein
MLLILWLFERDDTFGRHSIRRECLDHVVLLHERSAAHQLENPFAEEARGSVFSAGASMTTA